MPLEKSAGAVIYRTHRPRSHSAHGGRLSWPKKPHREYLVLRYDAGHWDFPKGHLEGQESPEDAARREIREETGLVVRRFIPGFRRNIRYWLWKYPETPGGKPRRSLKIVTFFLAEVTTRDVRLSFEHTGYAWLPFRDAVKLVTYENARELLSSAETLLRAKRTRDKRG